MLFTDKLFFERKLNVDPRYAANTLWQTCNAKDSATAFEGGYKLSTNY